MRITRIYQDIVIDIHSSSNSDLEINTKPIITLDRSASHYLIKVLRFTTGDHFHLFNGTGAEYLAEVCEITKHEVTLIIQKKLNPSNYHPLAPKLHLCQGLCKGDKMDLIIQKAVELGVTEITPFYSDYSDIKKLTADRLAKKLAHWRKIIISATEQSGRTVLAKLNCPVNYTELLTNNSLIQNNHLVNNSNFLLSPRGKVSLKQILVEHSDLGYHKNKLQSCFALFIGPEGGFSAVEEQLAEQAKITSLALGPRILRTETAGLAMLAVIQAYWGDFYE